MVILISFNNTPILWNLYVADTPPYPEGGRLTQVWLSVNRWMEKGVMTTESCQGAQYNELDSRSFSPLYCHHQPVYYYSLTYNTTN